MPEWPWKPFLKGLFDVREITARTAMMDTVFADQNITRDEEEKALKKQTARKATTLDGVATEYEVESERVC